MEFVEQVSKLSCFDEHPFSRVLSGARENW